mgnify:CR=1 FL=1
MKVDAKNGLDITFEKQDNAELKENPEAVLKSVLEQFPKEFDSLVIQQNDEMKQIMIINCPIKDMQKVISKYVRDYNAEIDFIAEQSIAKMAVVAVRTETELKSGLYEYKKDGTLAYSDYNNNSALKRLFGSLK